MKRFPLRHNTQICLRRKCPEMQIPRNPIQFYVQPFPHCIKIYFQKYCDGWHQYLVYDEWQDKDRACQDSLGSLLHRPFHGRRRWQRYKSTPERKSNHISAADIIFYHLLALISCTRSFSKSWNLGTIFWNDAIHQVNNFSLRDLSKCICTF